MQGGSRRQPSSNFTKKALTLKPCQAQSLVQGSNAGLEFYVFEEIPKAKTFKDKYRRALDGLEVTNAAADRIVAEANVAFLMNMRLFSELDVIAGDASELLPLPDEIGLLQEQSTKPAAECPFASMGRALGLKNPHASEDKANGTKPSEGEAAVEGNAESQQQFVLFSLPTLMILLAALAYSAAFLYLTQSRKAEN